MIEENKKGAPGTALADALGQSGIADTIKGKVQRLALRLVAGGPGYEYYQKARSRLDIIEGRSRISNIVADELGRQALLDPEFMERAKARFLGDMAEKQENIEAVAAKAQEKIDVMPDAGAKADVNAPEPSQDWLNTFTREAELASSDELRERLAAILAGEARKPGTFSRSTVRFVAEADKQLLEEFQRALEFSVGDAIFREDSWNQGEWFSRGVMLESAGLITGSAGFTNRIVKIDANGNGFVIGNQYALVIKGSAGIEKQLSIFLLTRVGLEVAALLTRPNEFTALQRVSTLIEKSSLTQLSLGPHQPLPDGRFNIQNAFVVWDKDQAQAQETQPAG
jgi:hypothetical protein